MKKTTILIIVVLFMVIGYAAYNTTINIYGNGKLAENLSDFKVYLSNLKVNGKEVSGINNTKDEFTINDINGDISVDVINDSTEYDTESYLECVKEDENVGKVWNYDYTGGEQTFIVPVNGFYKLEVWGASGGTVDTSYYGGYGGYSTGTIKQTKGKSMYVNVGGKGTGATKTGESLIGGYNGGGNVTGSSTVNHMTASGGGATHIASISGLLSSLENNKNDIFIVSGGGGGGRNQANHSEAARWGFGGSGGGIIGGGPKSSLESTTSYTVVSSLAGTQTSGYAFGQGESASVQSAGGGGYYGGYSGGHSGLPYTGSGAGGSGYIGNSLLTEKSMCCYECTKSDEANTKTIDTTCTNSEPTENCAKIGNGYAKITLISSPSNITTDKISISAQESRNQNIKNVAGKSLTCKLRVNKLSRTEKSYAVSSTWEFNYTGEKQIFIVPTTGTYKLEVWGAQGGYAQTSEAFGGYGGYSRGLIKLNKKDSLYVIVGGSGGNGDDYSTIKVYTGGYNGGGNSKSDGATVWGAGGGATSIQNSLIEDGQLKNYSNNISNILIVSGGGGGAGWHYKAYLTNQKSPYNPHSGGSGGGFVGSNGITEKDSLALGGTQSEYGANGNTNKVISNAGFGYGGNYSESQYASGGGGGLYGGGSAYTNGSSGAGGSGYIGNSLLTEKSMYCYNCDESSDESSKTISTTCVSKTPLENCAKAGNGYARITLISKS